MRWPEVEICGELSGESGERLIGLAFSCISERERERESCTCFFSSSINNGC